jgi:hypothetical protein
MTELKNLKDLKTAKQINYFPIEAHQSPSEIKIWGEAVLVEDLKQEAIKWVKEYALCNCGNCGECYMKDKWIKFLNLTKEDLEEKEK